MVEADSLDAVRSALAPVDALRGEHSQLENWVRESFSTLETLHHELTEWQRDLTRQQAQLDQREASVGEAEEQTRTEHSQAVDLERQLAEARGELGQLLSDKAEQLETRATLERQLAATQTELQLVRQWADEQADTVDAERQRAIKEHRTLASELREMRRALERQSDMLISLGAAFPDQDGCQRGDPAPVSIVGAGRNKGSEPKAASVR
jgi:chromosome segregation ATPase